MFWKIKKLGRWLCDHGRHKWCRIGNLKNERARRICSRCARIEVRFSGRWARAMKEE